MTIDKQKCHNALFQLGNSITPEEEKFFADYCEKGVSMAELIRDEFSQHRTCSVQDAEKYILEEERQMSSHLLRDYNLSETSVAEHVNFEQNLEPEHAHAMYAPVPGNVKWFEEFLEGTHLSIGCMFNMANQVPPDSYYEQLSEARKRAATNRLNIRRNL